MQTKQEMATPTHGRHRSHSTSLAGHSGFGGLPTRGSRFSQERSQRNIRLVLKIQNCQVFPCFSEDFRHLVTSPFLPRFFVAFVVLTFRLLISQSCFSQSSPNGVSGNGYVKSFGDNTMQTANGPQIRLVTKLRRSLQDDLTKFLFTKIFQFPRASTACFSFQPILTILLMPDYPAIQRATVDSVSTRDSAILGHAKWVVIPWQNRSYYG